MQETQVATRSFRLALAHLWLWAGAAHLALLAVMLMANNLAGLNIEPIWLIVMCIVPSAYWIAYGLKFRLTVFKSGIGWINGDGVECFFSWSDIEKAKQNKQLGLPLLMVWSKSEGGPYWMPIAVTNRDLLRDALKDAAGEMHPVTAALADGGAEAASQDTAND